MARRDYDGGILIHLHTGEGARMGDFGVTVVTMVTRVTAGRVNESKILKTVVLYSTVRFTGSDHNVS
jgi:hypothetical protein